MSEGELDLSVVAENAHVGISFYKNYSGQTLSKHLGWSYYCELLSISDKDKRSFYEKECSNARCVGYPIIWTR